MTDIQTAQEMIVRTERGLTLAGTRITLYDILGYLHAAWPTSLIQHWLNITPMQLQAALDYIATHREPLESEYQTILEHAASNRKYWEKRTLEVRKRVANSPIDPRQEELQAMLKKRKAELGME